MSTFDFPVGWYDFHPTQIFNYQLNRWHSMGYLSEARCREAGSQIRKWKDWPWACEKQAKASKGLERAFWYRAAEFFVSFGDPEKERFYTAFSQAFNSWMQASHPEVTSHSVPYENRALPVLEVPSVGPEQSTVLLFGGFDSFKEEFFSLATVLADGGHRVLIFEGPGQGAALHEHGLPMHYAWEKPTGAVLDHFGVADATLIGISMGGWLCFRAGAFEPRIRRIIASSIAYDYLLVPPKWAQRMAKFMLKLPGLIRFAARMKAALMPQERWGMQNMQGIFREKDSYQSMLKMLQLNAENQQAHRVTQDVRIHTGAEDHFIPLKMHHLQVVALTNAHSLSECIYTRADHAQNHCQVGNWGLAARDMVDWVDQCLVPKPAQHEVDS